MDNLYKPQEDIYILLSGPIKAERLAALDLLKQKKFHLDVIQLLELVENVPATITNYRDRERLLEKILNELTLQKENLHNDDLQVVVFHSLLGSLYVNFEKFWGPTIRVITDLLAQSKIQSELLNILISHLKDTNDIIYNGIKCNEEDRPDHVLHRNFIFQLLFKFVHHIQENSVLFMDEFFRLVDKELLVSPFIEKFTRDNLVRFKETLSTDEDNQDQLVVERNDQKKAKSTISSEKFCNKRNRVKIKVTGAILQKQKSKESFLAVSKIIQSFRDIHKIHRQEELKNIILELLCCRDGSVQKASFNCLLAYEDESIKPYTEQIMKIMNDKMVKTEMTMFSLDENEASHIQEKDRPVLLPVILRVLFGKMIGKIGRKSSGRDKADSRKTLIMRFVAGCSSQEITYFFNLLFDPIYVYSSINYEQLESALSMSIDLDNYVPLNKLQAMLGSLSAYMNSIAHLKEEPLTYVLKLINIISYYVIAPLEDQSLRSRIHSKNIALLKSLRRECLNITAEYFKMFEYYKFKQEEINFIFKYQVWTSTSRFIDKNYANPTPLLKLIEVFASNKVYHQLLVKRNKSNLEEYLLRHIIDLYSDRFKPTRIILKFIASTLADIINPDRNSIVEESNEQFVKDQETPILTDEDAVVPEYCKEYYRINKDLLFNQEILIGFIPRIFERLKQNCQDFVAKKDSDYRIENDELLILSTLSDYLKDSEQSLLGARLLLTTLEFQRKGDLILNTLKTAQALMKQVEKVNDPTIVPLVSNILSYQRNVDQRKELCTLIDIMSMRDKNLKTASKIIKLMNQTNLDILDIPDLVKWNEGFHLAFSYLAGLDEATINKPEVVKDSIMLLLHQVGFIINNVDKYEFSIRENCMIFFEKFAQKVKLINSTQNSDLLHLLIDEILLEKYIKKGLRESNDVIKFTFVGILRALTVECHDKNSILDEFYLFCSDNQDLDFWLNIRHIQLHNRSKALARLVSREELKRINPKTLSSYFMPLAAGFLFSKTYKSVSSLAENSIKLIGIICKQLNWVTYRSTLSYYLDLLTKANATYQRTNIRLITEILKNFNYDMTACKEAMENEEENLKLEQRMKKRKGVGGEDVEVIATDAPSGKRLNPSTARMVYFSVTKQLLPRLNSCLHEMTRVEYEHDKNMADYLPEKEEIKRIPIAYAIVQLLNLLPGRYVLLRDQLPSLILKLSSFLKSKNEQVRKVARATLVKIMSFVGPTYIPDFLRILKQNLDKGFQIHVLNYTIHSVLDKMTLHYGSLDHSVQDLVNSCFQEIFGKLADDKEIAQILAKTFEAKKTKSYDTLVILSSYISADKLDYLMNSIKEVLKNSNEPKKVNKLSTCVQKVFTGLSKNDAFPLDKKFTFIQVTIEETIPSLKVRKKLEQAEKLNSIKPLREDRFLITKEVPRDRVKSKINEKGNLHIVVDNCLRLLLLTFEKNRIIIGRKETVKRKLDGLINLLTTCLKSTSPKCVMRALKCIYFIAQTKADLPSFKTLSNKIVKKIFILLQLYNGVGMVQGDNFEMIAMCFKTLTLLLLKCEHIKLNDNQVRALLTYIEQDLHDTSRQATAFGALNSLLHKRCNSPELVDIMVKIADLLVTSEDESVRTISIKIWKTYLLEYQHEGNKLQTHLTKFLRQLDYEFVDGRKSILKMLNIVISKFPEKLLRLYYELIFHLLSQRLVNDESKEVRGLVGRLLGLLVQRLPDQQDHLFNRFVIPWASGSIDELKLLGIKLISVFVETRQNLFSDRDRMKKVLSIVASIIEREEIVQEHLNTEKDINMVAEEVKNNQLNVEEVKKNMRLISVTDKLNYHSLKLLRRFLNKGIIKPIEMRYIEHLKRIWHSIGDQMLCNWHLPIVLESCQLYLIFIKQTELAKSLNVLEPSTNNYLDWNAKRIVRNLCDKYIDLLDRSDESNQLLSYITESMIYLGQLVASSKETLDFEDNYCKSFGKENILDYLINMQELPNDGFVQDYLPYSMSESKKRLSLMWLVVKVVLQARKEAALFRLKKYYRRNFVLRWTAVIAQELGAKRLLPYAVLFTMTPIRELTDKGKGKANDELLGQQNTSILSEDLLKFIKSLIGTERFNKVYSRVQLHYTRKRVDRKKKEALLKVKDQARGVKRKMKQHKDNSVKRKLNHHH